MDIELLMKSQEYLTAKKIYENEYFKLLGKYCKLKHDGCVEEKQPGEMAEKFANRVISHESIVESTNNKGVTTSIKKMIKHTFFEIWRKDPTIPEYDNIVFECDKKKVHKSDYNLFTGFNHFDKREKKKKVDIGPLMNHIFHLAGADIDKQNEILDFDGFWECKRCQLHENLDS